MPLPAIPDGYQVEDATPALPKLPDGYSLEGAKPEPSLGERFMTGAGSAGAKVSAAALRVAGGIANIAGAHDTADSLERSSDAAEAKSNEIQAQGAGGGITGQVAQGLGALPSGLASYGIEHVINSGADTLAKGGSMGEAVTRAGINAAATVGGAKIGDLGKGILSRMALQGAASGALNEGARVAENAMSPDDQQQPFDPVNFGLSVGSGAAFGLLPHAPPREAPPPPPPEPRGITYQPDVITDSQGRAVMNKGDRTLGQPVGGAFEDQAPTPKPAGPISAALDAGGIKPPEEPTAAAVTPPPNSDNSGDAAAEPAAKPSLVDAYTNRQQQIDALNAQRKAGQLDEDGLNNLHDMRDIQDGHDPLTGLLNQKGFDDAQSKGGFTHIAALDLDQFKPVNDTFGHAAGDTILQHVAQVLHDSSEGNVTVARLHGDEYAGLAKGDPTQAMATAQKTLRESPFTIDYVDKDGNPHTHTFDGIGITFGVGKDYDTADQAANAAKPKGGRRNTDPNEGSVRSEDVQAAAGSVGDEAQRGQQADLPGEVSADESPARETTAGESRGASAVERAENPSAAGEQQQALRERAAAESEGRSQGVGRAERIEASQRDHFDNLEKEIGWDQEGGKLLREPPRADGLKSEVAGRTQWVGKAGYLGESALWRDRPDKALTPKQAQTALAKAKVGGKLKPIEQRFVDHAQKTARIYAEAEEHFREEEATRRGFDSVDAMHDHDAHNFIGSDYDGSPREDIPFSKSGSGEGLGKDVLAKTVGDVTQDWKGDAPKVEVHQSHDDAPAELKNSQGFDKSVEGAYDPKTGTVHLFADAIKSPERATQVLAHEAVGHYGVEGVLGKEFPKLVADINKLRAKPSPAMKKIFDEVERRYKGADPHTFASEAMAVMSEKGIRNSFTDRAIAAVRKFVRGLGVNLKLSDAELRQMLVAADRRVKGSGGQTVQRDGSVKFHKAYHGSPHDFDKFDSSKIGTGEGAQAYGHGLYFAGKKEVADYYKDTLADKGLDTSSLKPNDLSPVFSHIAKAALPDKAAFRLREELRQLKKEGNLRKDFEPDLKKLNSLSETGTSGRGYEVELAPKEHEYLDHDKAIGEQSKSVQDALAKVAPDHYAKDSDDYDASERGQMAYQRISSILGSDEAASKALHEAGIPGIKYLDGSSRGKGDGAHNYVIFNDKDVQVTAKYSKRDTATGDMFGGGEKPKDEREATPRPSTGDLFGGASSRDHVDAAVRAKDDKLSGKGAAPTMRQGDGELFAGNRPDQAKFSKADTADGKEESPSFLDKVTGLLKPGAADRAAKAINDAALKGRELARNVSRAAWAMRDRATGQADAAIDAFRTHFDKRSADVRGDPLKSYESVIAYQQKKPIADPVEKKFIDTVAGMLDKQASAIRAFGEDKLGLLDQYFPQLWKDPERAEKMYSDMQAKRPLAGPKGFTKERVFADMEQGIKAGMKPAFDNPADALMARYQSGERYLAALRIKDGIDKLGMLQDIGQGDRVPQGFARVNDNTFAGKVVPELVAKDLNNYLAPGLSQFKAWRGFRWMQNALLSARLGFSAFHAGFTTVDSAMTHFDLGMRKALSGDIGAALKHLGQIPLTPFHALQGLAGKGEGAKLVRQFYGQEAIKDPQTAAVLDALTQGGARGRMDPTDYNNDFAQALRTLRTDGIKGLAKTPLKSIGAVLEGVMRPIAHNLVPAQKMTARVELMKYELDRVASQLGEKKGDYAAITKAMNQDALRQVAHSVVQRVDDRLGQLSYDNLFWNRTVKDILQASIQSVGWNVGTKNVIFGGLGDVQKIFKPESLLAPLDKAGKITDAQMSRITGRLSYLVALNLGVGALGAATQYMLTGQGPQELKDYFFPKTGNKNPDGTDARISFPSYVKDEFGFARHPIETVEHKLHPSFSMVAELLNNKDFYGNEVYDPDAPWSKVAEEVAGHVVKGFLPYAVQNQQNIAQSGGSLGARAAPFVGITPAPGDETHSDAQNYISNAYYSAHPSESKTPEQADHSHAFTQAVNAIRQGQQTDLSQFTPAERAKITKYAHEDPAKLVEKHFAALSLQQQVVAYQKASDAERKQYNMRGTILKESSKGLQKISDADARSRIKSKVDEIRAGQ